MDVSVVLTSAVVGAVVSSLFAVVSQFLERRARQRELLMKAATDLAMRHLEQAVTLMKANGGQTWPLGLLVYDDHLQLTSVWKYGRLPPDAQKDYEAWRLVESERSTPSGER